MEKYLLLVFLGINTWVDMRQKRISLLSVAVFGIAGILYQILYGRGMPLALLGLIPGLILLLVSKTTGEAMGMGDGLVILVLGLYLGWSGAVEVLLLALFLSAFWAGFLLTAIKKGRNYEFPFAPFVLLGYAGRLLLWGG